jgi:parvulin-like peptidyl-prolyl isomerase
MVQAALLTLAVCTAWGQQGAQSNFPPTARAQSQGAGSNGVPRHLNQIEVQPLTPKLIPVSPGDPIAVVNNQVITRQQLADECVARKGKEILELLINRTLIDQALRAKKSEITGADIDQEIENIAQRFGVPREKWLLTLEKERGISPIQYARDIIYPGLALRRLCSGRVQVTPDDLKKAFESYFGDKLRVRMILVEKQTTATEIWGELRKNPGAFENLAKERSIDPNSASIGGLLAQPITRHAVPENLSDKAYRQLVDGDSADHDPTHKPKDGDFTGPIEVGELGWVILRRESVEPAVKGADLKDPRVQKQTYDMIYEVKLKEAMATIFEELVKGAAIENQLTGTVKLANEERHPDYATDNNLQLMSGQGASKGGDPRNQPGAPAAPRMKMPPPAALSPEAAKQFDSLNRPLKQSSGSPASSTATSTTPATPNN